MSKGVLSGKRFLITQSSLRLIAGSEINTLEIAEYLQSQGAIVTVYAYFFSQPISLYFEEKKIKVVTDESKLDIDNYDYVWVHHQVIPYTFIGRIAEGSKKRLPIFIFLHMSGLKTHYLEQAYIWELEERVSSKTLYVSDEAKENVATNSLNVAELDEGFYRNPTPTSFTKIKHIASKSVKHVLVVSNHPVDEVIGAAKILRKKGIKVVIAGEGRREYKLVEPEYLNKFDVIISIGKTVQYCLVSNIPVYIYDVWGGPGYLNTENEANAAWYNFSGRGYDKKDSEAIAEDIIANYNGAVKYQTSSHRRYISEYSLESVLPRIIKSAKSRNVKHFRPYYTQYLTGALMMIKYKFYHENLLVKRDEEIKYLNDNIKQKNMEHSAALECKDVEIARLLESIHAVERSRAYRLSLLLARPIRFMKKIQKNTKK